MHFNIYLYGGAKRPPMTTLGSSPQNPWTCRVVSWRVVSYRIVSCRVRFCSGVRLFWLFAFVPSFVCVLAVCLASGLCFCPCCSLLFWRASVSGCSFLFRVSFVFWLFVLAFAFALALVVWLFSCLRFCFAVRFCSAFRFWCALGFFSCVFTICVFSSVFFVDAHVYLRFQGPNQNSKNTRQ